MQGVSPTKDGVDQTYLHDWDEELVRVKYRKAEGDNSAPQHGSSGPTHLALSVDMYSEIE